MSRTGQPVRIAINVMRARLTVVAFNLAIVTVQLGVLPRLPGAMRLPGSTVSVHLSTDITLLVGLALSVLALVSFIVSSAFDEQGTCTHWTLLAGDLFMYLGLAHSVSGFFAPFAQVLTQVSLDLPSQAQGLKTVRLALVIAGGAAWCLATYVGPLASLLRSPFGRRITLALGASYLVVLFLAAYVSRQALLLEAARSGVDAGPGIYLLHEFLQPLRW